MKAWIRSIRLAITSCLALSFGGLEIAQDFHTRSYFYVGGKYVDTPTGHLFQDQMYVEKLSPTCGQKQAFPIIFIHGNGQTGTVSVSLLI